MKHSALHQEKKLLKVKISIYNKYFALTRVAKIYNKNILSHADQFALDPQLLEQGEGTG